MWSDQSEAGRHLLLLAQIREVLGADRFDQVFATSSRLSQLEAVATVRDRRGADAAS